MNQFIKFLVETFDFSTIRKYANINESDEEDNSIEAQLDRYLKGEGKDLQDEVLKTNAPIIYAFITTDVPDAIKIGYTDQGAYKRLTQWAAKYKKVKLVGYWTSREFNQQAKYVFFKDFPVHKRVIDKGHYNLTKDDFDKLRKQSNLTELHVSREFFRKINDKTHDDKDILSREIIAEIIRQMKEEIKAGNADFTLYELLEDGTVSHVDKIMENINTFEPTPLQQQCIDKAKLAIEEGKTDLLMAAVMRFGKTFTTYQIIKQTGLKYVLVTSAKADTRTAWRNDISHKDFINDFCFIEFDGQVSFLISEKDPTDGKIHTASVQNAGLIQQKRDEGKIVIVYATLQDLAGKSEPITDEGKSAKVKDFMAVNTIKKKHEYLFSSTPDIMVIDETHFGSHANKFGAVTGLGDNVVEDIKDIKKDDRDHQVLNKYVTVINAKRTLQCSGTPYYILASGEFGKEYENKTIISDVSFSDMLAARDKWDEDNQKKDPSEMEDPSKSPYYGIPNIYKFGMKLTKSCENAIKEHDIDTRMSELFRIKNNQFVHKDAIKDLMISLYGDSTKSSIGFINTKKIEDGEIFKHTIIVLPQIKMCQLLEKLLLEEKIIDPNKREVIVVVNDNSTGYSGNVKDADALNKHLADLEAHKPEPIRSIILTVNRFLTGVTMPLVDSMIFMKDTQSPQEYDQAIFRLCSRNIGIAVDSQGNKIKINRKANVYLIDFNITRMFKMTIDSTIAQAAAKGKTETSDLKEYLAQNLKDIPIYTDSIFDKHGKEVLKGIHSVIPDDLLKEYVKYNNEKSIEDCINDSEKAFSGFFSNLNNINLLQSFSANKMGGNGLADKEGTDSMNFDFSNMGKGAANHSSQPDTAGDTQAPKMNKKDLEELKNKFKNMIKTILYCNICFDKPAQDIKEFIRLINNYQDLAKDFGLDIGVLNNVYRVLNNQEKLTINSLLYQLYVMSEDKDLSDVDKVMNSIHKLGKIDKSEVVTPPGLVDKMINKLNINDIKNAGSILLVNEKYGEFFMGLYRKFNGSKSILSKCKIAPSSAITRHFCKKVVKQLGLSESIILDIEDLDSNGKYDIKDFLVMKNEEILKMNKGQKFDVILANPPYDKTLHEKFLEKFLYIAETIVSVQPLTWLTNQKQRKKITELIDQLYTDIETITPGAFFDATIAQDMAIHYITNTKKHQLIFDGKIFDKCSDVNKFSTDAYLSVLYNNILNISYNNLDNNYKFIPGLKGHPKDKHIEYNPKDEWFIVKGAAIRGHAYGKSGKDADFYTLIPRTTNKDFNKFFIGTYKTLTSLQYRNTQNISYYWKFDTLEEMENFIKYIQTDFCRACLMLNKTTQNIIGGSLKNIPWFDFSDPVFSKSPSEIDDYLFVKYIPEVDKETGITRDEIRKHIEELLPDYYSIRNKN